ncbi:MAG TPA: TetR/AcrR family transcriptional regulator [Pseudonocardiaceae bacterium]|jgi:AcrR family transcriptional regulator|nr:TetR/AcrR family transcriptional regulator [Pseudonocardiaceae bacterium]
MNIRQQHAADTRRLLVDAGLRMAERTGLPGLSVNVIVAEAGVAKGTFFHHFGDRSGFLVAVHREFHDRLFAEVTEAVGHLPPGRERLLASTVSYLDICLRRRGIRALLLEARAEPAIAEAIAERNKQVVQLTKPDFAAMGWSRAAEGAALWTGLVVEAALLELAAGRQRPPIREALARFLN